VRKLRRAFFSWRIDRRSASSLVPLMVFSLLAALLVSRGGAALAYSYFQSPESPISTAMPAAGPTEEAPPQPEQPPVAPPGETPGELPTSPALPEASPAEGIPPEEGVSEPTPTEESPPEGLPGEEATGEQPSGDGGSLSVRGLSLATMVDTCVVGLSSVWLCCGGLVLAAFILLMIASFLLRVT
jgi:hypothetical protein